MDTPENETSALPELSPQALTATGRVFSLVALLVNLTLLGIAGYLTTIVRLHSVKVFTDCEMELPFMTAMLLSIPAGVCIASLGLIGCVLAWVEYAIANQTIRLSIHIFAAILMLIFTATYCLSLLVPMMGLMRSMP
jgi:hypothetical protein